MRKAITATDLNGFEKAFNQNPANHVAMNAATSSGLGKAARNYQARRMTRHVFSISLEQGEITHQKATGRCWMFAALNVLRFGLLRRLNVKTFELSQGFTLFYDKLEKANYFLESILSTLDEPTEGRLIAHLLQAPIHDGGQWDMLVNLIDKYGIVPKETMPDTENAAATHEVTRVLTTQLRGFAAELRQAHRNGSSIASLRTRKTAMMKTVYRILCIALGKPPQRFNFEYTDKDGTYVRATDLTPKEFYDRFIGVNLHEYVSLIHAPTADKPYSRSYTVRFLGNVAEGRIVRYVNCPADVLRMAAIAQLQAGEPVWFGCDVGQQLMREEGLLDLKGFDYASLLGIEFPMDKATRLDYGDSLMNHAMVFQGVDLDDNGKPQRWRVENSWGEDQGRKGYLAMTDDWFGEYLYQIVVHRSHLPEDVIAAYESDPIVLEPWDPMGSLA